MKELEELIKTADRLCQGLEEAANNEKKWSYDICHHLEVMSYEAFRTARDLIAIRQQFGG